MDRRGRVSLEGRFDELSNHVRKDMALAAVDGRVGVVGVQVWIGRRDSDARHCFAGLGMAGCAGSAKRRVWYHRRCARVETAVEANTMRHWL
jgi:hypothetical protein